jgi:hypothetical protein
MFVVSGYFHQKAIKYAFVGTYTGLDFRDQNNARENAMKQNFTAVSEESLFRVTRDWLQYT